MFTISGGNDEGVTPVPIPNTEVKPFSADSTWLVTARESRSPPDPNRSPAKAGDFSIGVSVHSTVRKYDYSPDTKEPPANADGLCILI